MNINTQMKHKFQSLNKISKFVEKFLNAKLVQEVLQFLIEISKGMPGAYFSKKHISFLLFRKICKNCCKRRICLYNFFFLFQWYSLRKTHPRLLSQSPNCLYKLSQCEFIAGGGGRGREEEKEKWEGGQCRVQRYLKILKQQSKISASKKLQSQLLCK